MRRNWIRLAMLIGVLAAPGYAADRGDPVLYSDTDELDVPSLKVGGVPVSTEAGTSGNYAPALLATTENITLSGEQTIDGVLTSADAIVVWMQTNAAQNGIYVSGGGSWARRTDMDIAGEFAGHQSVYVQAGTRFAGTTFRVANVSAVTVGTTAIVLAPDAPQWHVKALQTIATSGSIDCTPPPGQVIGSILPIVGDGAPVTLGSPQIIAGTRINQFCHILGTDGANTVEMGDGSGVQLAQSELPLIFNDRLTALMRWDGTIWRQVDQAGVATGAGIGTLQQAYQAGDVGGFTSLPQSRPYVKAPSGELGPRVLIHDGGGSGDYIEERLVGVNTPGSLPTTLIQPDDSFTVSALLGDPLSEIIVGRISNIGGLAMSTEGIFNATQDHIDTNIGAHDAWAIGFAPAGTVGSSTTQQAIEEVSGDIEAHLVDTAGAHAATAISFSPTGTIAATTVQAAIAEVASEAGAGTTGIPILMGHRDPSNTVTSFVGISGSGSNAVLNVTNYWPAAGTFTGLRCSITTAPGAGNSWTIRLRIGSVFGSLSDVDNVCVISDSATSCLDTTSTDAITVGQYAEYSIVPASTPTTTLTHRCGIVFTPS